MSVELIEYALEELGVQEKNAVVGGPFGSNLVSKDYVNAGVPVIRGQNMGGRWVSGEFAHVSESKAKQLLANTARPGDLVFTQRGTLGQVSIVPSSSYKKYIVSQSQMKITVNPVLADVTFLYYYFSSPEQVEYVKTNAIQTGVPHTNLGILRKTPVHLPSLCAQKAIVKVLSGLDDMIELNHQINQTLEQMAQALFKNWFVDFEPVKAKITVLEAGGSEEDALLAAMQVIAGDTQECANVAKGSAPGAATGGNLARLQAEQPEQPEQYAELRATAELFPSAMQDSELGEIPEGWNLGALVDICNFQNGYAFKSKGWADSGCAVVKIGSVKPGFVDLRSCSYVEENTLAGLERFELFAGDLLVGMTGYPGETGLVPITDARIFLNQRVGRLKAKQQELNALIYCNARAPEFKQYVEGQAHGSAQANVSGKAISQYPVVIPCEAVIARFSEVVSPLIRQKLRLNSESNTLAATRDTLLPKLLSGELSTTEAETQLTAAEETASV
jgi:type I restriction enzyme S subunit